MKKIIAIVGMAGAGKSVLGEYLIKKGFKGVYFGGVTMAKLKEQGLEVTPENEKMMREKLRSELGMGAFAKILLPEIFALAKDYDVVLDGLYSWDELKILQEKLNFITVAMVVDKDLRYERISKREFRPLTKEEVKKRDISEIENIAKGGPICYADYYILNNGKKEDIYKRIDEILERIENEEV